jgi:hypothetical protein
MRFHYPSWMDEDHDAKRELREFCRTREWISSHSPFGVMSLATGGDSPRRSFANTLFVVQSTSNLLQVSTTPALASRINDVSIWHG